MQAARGRLARPIVTAGCRPPAAERSYRDGQQAMHDPVVM
jgi:hypothetical protein